MNQILRHHFSNCSVQQCERLFFLNQDFCAQAGTRAKTVVKLEKLTINNQAIARSEAYKGTPSVALSPNLHIDRITEVTSHRPIKSSLRQYFNLPQVSFKETLNYKTNGHSGKISIIPMMDICTVEGNIALQKAGDGVDRTLSIDVKMRKRWFFIKWIAESYILKSVAHSYDEIQGFTDECLAKNPAG